MHDGHDKFSQVRASCMMNWPKLPTEENMSLESFPSLEMAQRVTKVKDKNIRDKTFFKRTLKAYHCNQNQIQK